METEQPDIVNDQVSLASFRHHPLYKWHDEHMNRVVMMTK